MGSIGAFLAAVVGPLAKRVLVALGIGVVSYAALSTLVGSVVSALQSNWGQVTGAVLAISSLGGIPQALGIITGALIARVAYQLLGQLGRVTT